jgi:hypothetical protein
MGCLCSTVHRDRLLAWDSLDFLPLPGLLCNRKDKDYHMLDKYGNRRYKFSSVCRADSTYELECCAAFRRCRTVRLLYICT